ncbi:MAG: NAD(P)-binding protein [Myxococcales bacterium]|nr:NAD(P)-binding protein [Myxococcales bacterium]
MTLLDRSALRDAARLLDARTRALRTGPARPTGRYVLYWCTTALRAEENPAFERALVAAHKLDQPLVVYHGLSTRYAHANDRITGFVLEGEAALRRAFESRGARYVFALDRGTSRTKWLDRVADGASVVVTDDFPVYDVRGWVERFAERFDGPVLSVDAACVVPMRSLGRGYERAFAFRQRVSRLWKSLIEPIAALPLPRGLEHTESTLDELDTVIDPSAISDLVAALPIDHTVPRSDVLRGGIDAALARWTAFTKEPGSSISSPIDEYDARRNDALEDDGVSRMSAYLHWGMIWAGRLAREAMARDTDGADKWVDELLVWRELAWHFCAHNPGYADVATAIPKWARETLSQRAQPMFAPTELAMELGETGNALWDGAQRRLRRDGYLHNNLRMTWGKQIVAWVHDPAKALAILESLNHRYAIDGRDPASYGGLLWTMGQFDRPHPRTDDFGTVRPRDTKTHAKRLNVASYSARGLDRHRDLGRVLVVGAGLSGAACARTLFDAGVDVTVIDKGKSVGGRAASRRVEGHTFSHGAPVLHGSALRFGRWLALLEEDGLVTRHEHGAKARKPLTHVVKRLLAPLQERVRCDVRATHIEKTATGWIVTDAEGRTYACERLVVSAPAPQAAALVGTSIRDGVASIDEDARARLASVRYARRLVAMALCEAGEATGAPFDRGIEGDAIVSRITVQAIEHEGRARVAIVAHASDAYTEARYDEGEDGPWSEALIERARTIVGAGALVASGQKRWRYARPSDARASADGRPFVALDRGETLFAIGDGVHRSDHGYDAEAAWESGAALASWMMARRAERAAPSERARGEAAE